VFPTRSYLAQRAAIARAEEQLSVLSQENDRLEDRIDALNSPEEIERMAREDFELVMPGEQPYVVLPAPEPAVPLPRGWPFSGLADAFPPPG
jgi:cell division protein FtsB